MLIKCPECRLEISDKAIMCPHCGFPLVPDVKRAYTKPTKRAHRKLPNGFGSITEIKGRYLRNPFLARICVGKTDEGRPILRNLKPKAYFKTYNDAYQALVEYNREPDYYTKNMIMEDLFKKWYPEYAVEVSESMQRSTTSCWKKCSKIYKEYVQSLKAGQIREIIDAEPSANMKLRIKGMFDQMLDYAMEYDIVERNVSKSFKVNKSILQEAKNVKDPHVALTRDEISMLWDNVDKPYVDIMLIQIYTGMRAQELLNIKNSDVHDNYIIGGSKTNAGKNRIIPIHQKIKELIFKRKSDAKYLFMDGGSKISYPVYSTQVKSILPSHRSHDFRKTFVTYAQESNMASQAIKRIVGHQLDVTEGTYTERPVDWLITEMNKLDV